MKNQSDLPEYTLADRRKIKMFAGREPSRTPEHTLRDVALQVCLVPVLAIAGVLGMYLLIRAAVFLNYLLG